MKTQKIITELPKFRLANIKNQYNAVKVFTGSEENIFNEIYMSCLVDNRLVKFKKSILEFYGN